MFNNKNKTLMKEKFLLVLILIAFASSPVFSQDLPDGWYTDEVNPGEDIHLFQESEMVTEGMYSCKMVLLNGNPDDVPYLLSNNFDVTEGEAYTFTLWYFDNDIRGELKVYADFYDAEGGDVYGEDPVFTSDGDVWQSITWTATVPTDAVEGYIWIKFYPIEDNFDTEAIIYVDGVSFVVDETNLVANGGFELWGGVGVPESNSQVVIDVYPNPFTKEIYITGADFDRITVFNINGQKVLEKSLVNGQTIELDQLSKGTYFLNVYRQDELIGTKKLMK
jgi:hypothetical protein